MSRSFWAWARPAAGAAILAAVVFRIGTGPFLDGIRRIDAWSLAATTSIAAVTTVCCAWRWRIVARGLGVGMPCPVVCSATYTELCIMVAMSAMSAEGCVPSPGNAPPGRQCSSY